MKSGKEDGLDPLEMISPIDGRYRNIIADASELFSEVSLIKHRSKVELEYLIALLEIAVPQKTLSLKDDWRARIRSIYDEFDIDEARAVKRIEQETRHDVKALELYLREKFEEAGLQDISPLLHLCLTSEDVNNLAYALIISEFLRSIYVPSVLLLLKEVSDLAERNEGTVMLSRTHGQPATPTTLGRELSIYCYRIAKLTQSIALFKLPAKIGGAVGNLAAHRQALPWVDWPNFLERFVQGFGFEPWPANTQVMPHDRISELLSLFSISSCVLANVCRDLWTMAALGNLFFRPSGVGSSTMPHKSNPVEIELAEGNLDLAASMLQNLASRLISSRLQRDLSDSTIKRNYGVALCHLLLGVRSLRRAFERITVDTDSIERELTSHPEVLSEAYQVVLRLRGDREAYEKIMAAVQGRKLTATDMAKIAKTLAPDEETSKILSSVEIHGYIGYSKEQTKALLAYSRAISDELRSSGKVP